MLYYDNEPTKETWTLNRPAFYAGVVLGVIFIACILALTACGTGGPRAVGKAPPDKIGTVASVAEGVGKSAKAIDEARADATAKAPEVQPESDRIGVETDRLRQYKADLDLAVHDLAATRKHVDELTKAVADRDAEIEKIKAEAESQRTSLMRWIFGCMAALALVGAVAAVLWLRNMPLAITCGGVVAACIGATYLLAWAKWLAIGLLALLALATAFALYRQWRISHELVLTGEAFKKADPNDKSAIERAAEQLQSEATKLYVRSVRDPIKRKLAQAEAFAKKV